MKRGEVWWVAFNPAVGSEFAKTRPAVIVSNDAANRHPARVVVVPFSFSRLRNWPHPGRHASKRRSASVTSPSSTSTNAASTTMPAKTPVTSNTPSASWMR